jgi:hypothetical protein
MPTPVVYWLTDQRNADYTGITEALASGFRVHFFLRCEDMLRQLQSVRPDVIIISTRGTPDETISDINTVCRNPEAKGLKMVLSLEREDPKSVHLAASLCFREILPLNLPISVWTKRFRFAVATKAQRLKLTSAATGDRQEAIIRAPSRITWIDKDRLCIETSVFFEHGATFRMLGPFAAFIGIRELPLTVLERQSKRLRYRHSSSIICKINVEDLPGFNMERLKLVSRGQSTSAPMNIYAIAKTQTSRQQIINAFGQHNVLFATKLTTAEKELEYFEPDALIIENSFLQNRDVQHLIGMKLTCVLADHNSGPIAIPKDSQLKVFRNITEIHRYLQLKVPMSQRAADSKWYIPDASDFSRCSVQFRGTVESVNKDVVLLHMPNRARNYALMEIATQISDAMNTSEFIKLVEPVAPAAGYNSDDEVAATYMAMVLCSSRDTFGAQIAPFKLTDVNKDDRVRNDQTSTAAAASAPAAPTTVRRPGGTPGSEKIVIQARPRTQIAPGHEFYEREELRDAKIAWQKPSAFQLILSSMDRKTVVQTIVLTLVGIGLFMLLMNAIENPTNKMSGFANWFSKHAESTGK